MQISPFRSTNFTTASVTRWLDNFFYNIWPFTRMKICLVELKIAKVAFKFCQILNKTSKIVKDFNFIAKVAKFYQIWAHHERQTIRIEKRNIFCSVETKRQPPCLGKGSMNSRTAFVKKSQLCSSPNGPNLTVNAILSIFEATHAWT